MHKHSIRKYLAGLLSAALIFQSLGGGFFAISAEELTADPVSIEAALQENAADQADSAIESIEESKEEISDAVEAAEESNDPDSLEEPAAQNEERDQLTESEPQTEEADEIDDADTADDEDVLSAEAASDEEELSSEGDVARSNFSSDYVHTFYTDENLNLVDYYMDDGIEGEGDDAHYYQRWVNADKAAYEWKVDLKDDINQAMFSKPVNAYWENKAPFDLVIPNTISMNNPDNLTSFHGDGNKSNNTNVSIVLGKAFTVTAMGDVEYSRVKSVTFPDNGLDILNGMPFAYCNYLEEFTLPANVNFKSKNYSNGQYAFQGCKNLKTLTFVSGNTVVPFRCCEDCTALEKIYLPDTIETIDFGAFNGCKSLKYINDGTIVPDSVTKICSVAFSDCAFTEITLPKNLSDVETGWFGSGEDDEPGYAKCKYLKNVYFSPGGTTKFYSVNGIVYKSESSGDKLIYYPPANETVKLTLSGNSVISSGAFGSGGFLKELIFDGDATLESGALQSNTSIESISFNGITKLGSYSLAKCTELKNVSFAPDAKVTFEGLVFESNTKIETLTLPKQFVLGLTDRYTDGNMQEKFGSFGKMVGLKKIRLYESSDVLPDSNAYPFDARQVMGSTHFDGFEVIDVDGFTPADGKGCCADEQGALYDSTGSTLVCYPTGVSDTNATTDHKNYTLSGNTIKIADYALWSVCGLESFSTGDGNKELTIGNYAFLFPQYRQWVPDEAYKTALKSVTLTSRVKALGKYAFQNDSSLENVIIEAGKLTAIPEGAFCSCSAIKELTLPDTVETVAESEFNVHNSPFYNCGFTSFTISKGMSRIPDAMFNSCSQLKEIVIPENITNIGNFAFYNCSYLNKVTILNPDAQIDATLYQGIPYDVFDGVGEDSMLQQCTFYVHRGSDVEQWLNAAIAADNALDEQNPGRYGIDWRVHYLGEYWVKFIDHDNLDYYYPYNSNLNGIVWEGSVSANQTLADVLPGGKLPVTQHSSYDQDVYTFRGWFEDTTNTAATLATKFTKDTNFYAIYDYQAPNYTLTLISDGKTFKTYSVAAYSAPPALPTPTKDGYTFVGWGATADATTPTQLGVHLTGNTTLYAIWKQNTPQGGGSGGNGVKENDTVKTDDGTYTVTDSGDSSTAPEVEFKPEKDASGKVTIDSTVTVNGQKATVTSIADNAFKGNTKVTEVVLPTTIEEIGTN
ncbi:MAG: leucine-rich repeat protein, partial [Lachnospiraceae bacterium]|nr:leucine-rich repeat protein [Lachnospiraceae bacterium]